MAIARILWRSLPRFDIRLPKAQISHQRHWSNKTYRAQLIEVDLDTAVSSSQQDSVDSATDVINFEINWVEDAIQGIIVRRAAPDWLPFLPGVSYWVPKRHSPLRNHRAASLFEVIGELGCSAHSRDLHVTQELTEDQQMSLTSNKGWPSSAFFIEGTSPIHPIMETEAIMLENGDNTDGTSSVGDV